MTPAARPDHRVFAALGDPTRLLLLERLRAGKPRSIATLSEGTSLTRQAVTKHLRVLGEAGLVHDLRSGREHLYALAPAPIEQVAAWAHEFVQQWDARLDRLEQFLQNNPESKP